MDRKNYIGNSMNATNATNSMHSMNSRNSIYTSLITVFTFITSLITLYALPVSTFAAGNLVVTGKVGIGKTNPLGNIHVLADGDQAWFYEESYGAFEPGSPYYPFNKPTIMQFQTARGSAAFPAIAQNNDIIFDIRGRGYDSITFRNAAIIRMTVDGTPGPADMPGRIEFLTTPDGGYTLYERMRINNAGNVGIGEPNPQHLLHLKNGAYSDGYTWETASSREYKENIKDLTKGEALLAINKLNPVTFNYKTDQEKNHVGFIAEDVPDLLASKDRKGLSPMDIVAVLTKVVQEQQKKISDLSEKVNRLEKLIK